MESTIGRFCVLIARSAQLRRVLLVRLLTTAWLCFIMTVLVVSACNESENLAYSFIPSIAHQLPVRIFESENHFCVWNVPPLFADMLGCLPLNGVRPASQSCKPAIRLSIFLTGHPIKNQNFAIALHLLRYLKLFCHVPWGKNVITIL